MRFDKSIWLPVAFVGLIVMADFVVAKPIRFARYPNICKGKIAFTYHDDIWVAAEDGNNPYRLTDHVAKDIMPRFSPDGQWIAFSSDRMGNFDLWVIPVESGKSRQITFYTADDTIVNWTPDGKRLIFQTSRLGTFGSPLYTMGLESDLPLPMDMDRGSAGMISQDGNFLAFNRLGFRYWRKHYRGNYNTDIWLQDLRTKEITQLTDTKVKEFRNHTQDAYPMWGIDGMIYFMSERDDIFNIWKVSPQGGQPVQVTFHRKDGVQYPSISPDGRTIIYENEFELWKLVLPDGEPEKISISLEFDNKENLIDYLQADSKADGFSPSPEGDYVAVDYHGEIFLVPTDPEVGEKKQITSSPWRDRYENFSPDGKYLSYASDESGEEEIWLYVLASGEKRKLTKHESTKRRTLWSKDSQHLAFTAANKLFTIDVESPEASELAYNEAFGFRVTDWSEDGKWLVYTRSEDDNHQDIHLFNIAEKKEYNVTQNPFYDSGGKLTPDDKKLVFTSTRDDGIRHLFVLPLQKVTEDKDDPLVREKKKKEENKDKDKKEKKEEKEEQQDNKDQEIDDQQKELGKSNQPIDDTDEAETESQDKNQKEKPSEPKNDLIIDMDRIDRRAVQLTSGTQSVSTFFLSKDGKTIYFTARDEEGSGLFTIGIDGKERKKIADGSFSRLTVTADKKKVFYLQDGSVYQMPLSSKKKEMIKFSFTVIVDKPREWEQIFEECWRVMKYRFYDEKMHGYDWNAIKAVYKPLLEYVGANQDLYDLANEMIGELNASHTGVRGPTREKPETYSTKFLGFEMVPDQEYYKVSHIYWDGPADKEWIDLKVGDYVLALDGKEIKAGDNYWRMLNHILNDYVTVKISPDPNQDKSREIRIKPARSLRNIKYEEWVKKNRDYVEELTNDEIAYVHIRSMSRGPLQRFRNEIDRFYNRKGIIVDIRYNGGGNIDQELLDILERRPYEFWNNRWAAPGMGRRPRQAIAGPKVMLINRRSASDSEVTPMGFRDLGLGRIVGNPTYGGVIATGSYRLLNGGSIRTPGALVVTYDPTKPNNYGINLENYGVSPDIWVENTPEDELKGYDRELTAAVKEVMRLIEEQKD